MTEAVEVECAVIGAGVVGLAVAAQLAAAGRELLVLEQHAGPGRETSSRNSEVVHAGLYYPPGSLKARLCVRGNRLLYDFCRRWNVPHRELGKLVVACTAEEGDELQTLFQRGEQNGAPGLCLLESADVRRMEPHLRVNAGLLSPSSGIVDSHALIKALEARTCASGGTVLYRSELVGIDRTNRGFTLRVRRPDGEEQLACRWLVNAAGLHADRVAAFAGVDAYRQCWCRGDYFAVAGPQAGLVSRLVYPVPQRKLTALGIHLTPDLGGRLRLGPDARYVDRAETPEDVDADRAGAFCAAVQRFLPELRAQSLSPDTYGIRAKLQGPGDAWQDFVIREESDRGCPGLINLVGIESPGLTATLAIAERVADLIPSP